MKTLRKIIVPVTDCVDVAANEIRGSLLSELSDMESVIIEPPIYVKEFSALHANFSLRLAAESYPDGTIFIVVFNPDQVRPKSLIGVTRDKKQIFMGRNTGIFDWITRDYGCEELYNVSNLFIKFSPQFKSFCGKLVTAPTIAKIVNGEDLSKLGKRIDISEIKRLNIPDFTIVHIDNFGMMKFTGDISNPKVGQKFKVEINDKKN